MLRTRVQLPGATLVSAVAGLLLALGPATPTHADATTSSDPRGDAPSRLDIAAVTYRNTSPSVSTRIRVQELTRAGRAEFYITTTGGTDVAYVATVASGPNGILRKRFAERANLGDTSLRCAFQARWDLDKNEIRIAVPRRCIPNAGAGAHYLRADMTAIDNGDRDYGPVAQHLARD